jgi:hypothetical protein
MTISEKQVNARHGVKGGWKRTGEFTGPVEKGAVFFFSIERSSSLNQEISRRIDFFRALCPFHLREVHTPWYGKSQGT